MAAYLLFAKLLRVVVVGKKTCSECLETSAPTAQWITYTKKQLSLSSRIPGKINGHIDYYTDVEIHNSTIYSIRYVSWDQGPTSKQQGLFLPSFYRGHKSSDMKNCSSKDQQVLAAPPSHSLISLSTCWAVVQVQCDLVNLSNMMISLSFTIHQQFHGFFLVSQSRFASVFLGHPALPRLSASELSAASWQQT